MLRIYTGHGLFGAHEIKSKIKSLLDTGDKFSPGRSRKTTAAKMAAVGTFGNVSSPSGEGENRQWRTQHFRSLDPLLIRIAFLANVMQECCNGEPNLIRSRSVTRSFLYLLP